MRLAPTSLCLLACLAGSGCVAGTNLASTSAGTSSQSSAANANQVSLLDGSNNHLPQALACTSQAPPPQAVRRLTQAEINNTVADLFADLAAPSSTTLFAGDATRYGFANVQEVLTVSDNAALELTLFAESVGSYAAGHAYLLSPNCQTPDPSCLGTFVDSFGPRAFRRPITADERAALVGLVDASLDFNTNLATLVTAVVQSPGFVYRTELGVADGSGYFVLTPYEAASWLSYTYTASMPDATLLAAAAANALQTPRQLAAQANRLLALPRARPAVEDFFAQWLQTAQLGLTVRSEGVEVLDAATKADMQAETQAFVDDVVFDNPGSVHDLYTRDQASVTALLSTYYNGPGTAGLLVPSSVGRAPGVLGQGAVLAVAAQPTYASPTLRGRMVRMRMLCGSVPVPPVGVPPLMDGSASVTLRQRLSAHVENASCAGCHDQMDPLGFALGDFDTLGRTRVGGLENGQLVDTSAAVVANLGAAASSTSVSGAAELAAYLGSNGGAQDCLARHWAMYGYGHITWPQDACTFDAAASQTRTGGGTLQGLLLSLVYAPNFLLRSPAAN